MKGVDIGRFLGLDLDSIGLPYGVPLTCRRMDENLFNEHRSLAEQVAMNPSWPSIRDISETHDRRKSETDPSICFG